MRSLNVLSLFSIFLCFIHICLAIELEEIHYRSPSEFQKRDKSVLDLRNHESFFWGAKNNSEAILGNFTIYKSGKNENILSMEKFNGMLTSIECASNGMSLKFEDDDTFAYAQRVWDWVNGADNHTFVMVAGRGDCGNNTRRIPYLVSAIEYDEVLNIAHLNATATNWKSLANSFELQVGSVSMTSGENQFQTRDITKDLSMSLAQNFPFKVKVDKGPISGELKCDSCKTTGKINFEFRVTQNVIAVPDGVRLRMTPRGVTAQANLKFTVASTLKSGKELFKETVASFPLDAVSIPGDILEIGPFLDIDVGAEISSLKGSLSIGSGATATLSDSAVLQVDLLDPTQNQFSGWLPTIKTEPVTVEAKISTGLQAFIMPAVRLRAEVLGKGVQTGLEMKMPYLEAKLEGVSAPGGGVCNDPKKTVGVKVTPQWGAELKFGAGQANAQGKSPVDITIGTVAFPLGNGLCFGFNSASSSSDNDSQPTQSTKPISAKATSISSTSSSNEASRCTVSSGIFGTCMSTTACASGGGKSEAGHCAGAANIQCCTYTTSTGGSCSANGVAGKCMLTTGCNTKGGKAVPGFCPGPENVQCCTGV